MRQSRPHALRVEHLDQPIGVGTRAPRLSWQLPEGAAGQVAYQVRLDDGWDSGRVTSSRSVLVPWPAPALRSAQQVGWSVKVWTDLGESDWSATATFETGLLDAADWQVPWIEPVEPEPVPAGERPGYLLRGVLPIGTTGGVGGGTDGRVRGEAGVVRARLYLSAHGLYEAFLNGSRVGDGELTPGFTQYDSRLQVQAYDVTDQVTPSENVLAVVLADGWYRGQVGVLHSTDQWGSRVALLAQLVVELSDSRVVVTGTGPGWRSHVGHVLAADLIAGERVDLRVLPRGWDGAGFDASGWAEATVVQHGYDALVASPAPAVRRVEELVPFVVTRPAPDRQVVDLGQNINGWVRLDRLGPAGTTVTLTHGEHLGPDGDVTTDHLRPDLPFMPAPLPAGQVDQVVSAGVPGEAFEPRRTTHGFRYVRVEGHPEQLTPDDVRGVVVHTDMRRTGWFSCSDERVNALHEAAVWSLRGNACDIPTDCPHRERAGWTGEWQLFVPTAAFLYDVAGFSTKWLRDVAADQWDDGTVANISPAARAEGRGTPMAAVHGAAGWGDAVVIVPWELYRAYGDDGILAELWPAMVAWLDRVERLAATARHPSREAARPVAAAHERYLWDTGFHWGEWLVAGDPPPDLGAMFGADQSDVATAYFAWSATLMARAAAVLDRPDDAARYGALAARVRAAWCAEFLAPDGRLTPDTQANHLRALALDLVPPSARAAVAGRLVELVRAAGTHLATGFLATPYLLPVLANAGHADVAYELLLQDTEPSWLTMIDRGATTVWEHWDGVRADGTAHDSLNHYSKGAVVSFLHRYVAGIDLDDAAVDADPGYRRFRVRPVPGGGITWAQAAHESPYGRIEVRWELDATGGLGVEVAVPAGTLAEVVLPDGRTERAAPGRSSFRVAAGWAPAEPGRETPQL